MRKIERYFMMRLGKIYLCFNLLRNGVNEKMAKSTGEKIAEKLKKGER
jgi:hypothetical protein